MPHLPLHPTTMTVNRMRRQQQLLLRALLVSSVPSPPDAPHPPLAPALQAQIDPPLLLLQLPLSSSAMVCLYPTLHLACPCLHTRLQAMSPTMAATTTQPPPTTHCTAHARCTAAWATKAPLSPISSE